MAFFHSFLFLLRTFTQWLQWQQLWYSLSSHPLGSATHLCSRWCLQKSLILGGATLGKSGGKSIWVSVWLAKSEAKTADLQSLHHGNLQANFKNHFMEKDMVLKSDNLWFIRFYTQCMYWIVLMCWLTKMYDIILQFHLLCSVAKYVWHNFAAWPTPPGMDVPQLSWFSSKNV